MKMRLLFLGSIN